LNARLQPVAPEPRARLEAWFAERGWRVQDFQRDVWEAWGQGRSGLLHAPTGSGKTLAVWGAALIHAASRPEPARKKPRLKLLWITPLRALAADTLKNLREPAEAMGLDWQIAMRTGDSSSRDRRLARNGGADALVTTPESLALLLSYADTAPMLSQLDGVIVDEWHELLGSKRGTLLELGLARLRRLAPGLRVWGLSATLGNLEEAKETLVPRDPSALLVQGRQPRPVIIETALPRDGERFPWAGHLGLRQLPRVLERVLAARSTLLFTNTRAQAELWHQALSAVWPEDASALALHHGSLDRKLRGDTETAIREGRVRCVVATSSLDLGVDFSAVDQVIQVGSPKGVARLLQRAGRAGHRPGEASRVLCIPTNALELVEFAAVRDALAQGRIEARRPLRMGLDVLAQHLVTRAVGGGFEAAEALAEARSTHAFAALDETQWNALLDFVVRGGEALQHYPDYRRVQLDEDGVHRLADRRLALRHRLSIGTIVSDGSMRVKFLRGADLGSVEEQFVGRLKPRDRFLFAGRCLELVQLKDMTAYVKLAKVPNSSVPRWMGGRMPLSTELSEGVQSLLAGEDWTSPEMQASRPLLGLQERISALPARDELLVEEIVARDGLQLFLFPFAGRLVHEGLAALMAARWGRRVQNSFSYAVNDYGIVIAPASRTPVDEALLRELLSPRDLVADIEASLNLGELAKRQFRDVARVAGLLPPSLPGRAARSLRALQASSGLLYDVLQRHDPGHLLLAQAARDVLEAQLDFTRLRDTLERLATRSLRHLAPSTLTPLAFPLWADRMRGSLSTEDWRTRVERAAAKLEARYA
jgi:ATP-dependent Lhr-like helicase